MTPANEFASRVSDHHSFQDPSPRQKTGMPPTSLAIADACKATEVCYDDFISTIAAGGYPCLPGACPGSPRTFDETDLLALYVYGRLLAFGFGALRAGEYACRIHSALRSNTCANSISIALVPNGGKRIMIGHDSASLPPAGPAEKIEFDIFAIRQFLRMPAQSGTDD